jgi:hypothetical protein
VSDPRLLSKVQAHPALFAAVIAAATVLLGFVKYGVGLHPEWRRFQDAAVYWPDVANAPLIAETDRSLLSNITAAWIAGGLGVTSMPWYLLFHLVVNVIALSIPFAFPIVRKNPTVALLVFVVLIGGPIVPIVLAWTGGYDAVLVIFAALAALSRRWWFFGIGWLGLGISHASVAAAMLLIWLPVYWVTSTASSVRDRSIRAGLAALGVGTGWVFMRAVTDAWGGSIDRFSLFQQIGWPALVEAALVGMPLILITVLGVGWVLLLDSRFRSMTSTRVMLLVALVAGIGLPLVALDQTRIAGLAVFVAMLTWVASLNHVSIKWSTGISKRGYAILAAVVPIPIVWEGAAFFIGWGGSSPFISVLTGA